MSQHNLDIYLGDDVERSLARPVAAIDPEQMALLPDEEHWGEPMLGIAVAVALSVPIWGLIAAVCLLR